MSPNLSAPFLDFVARRLQALAEPNRIRILKMLEGGEATVQDLTDELATTHQNVSRHLAVLYQSGMVSRRKDGRTAWYTLADFSALRLVEQAAQSASGYVEEAGDDRRPRRLAGSEVRRRIRQTDTLALGGQQAPVRCRDRGLLVVEAVA